MLLRWLGISCSAYLDDAVIYTNGLRKEHQETVKLIICALANAGLQLNWEKSQFEATSIKYLGFIIQPQEGIETDPEKIRAIQEWEHLPMSKQFAVLLVLPTFTNYLSKTTHV